MGTKAAIKRNKRPGKSVKGHKKTLPDLIEVFFEGLDSSDPTQNIPITPLVSKWAGAFKTKKNLDDKRDLTEALIEKHLK
jgi:hypothetical protein